MKDGFFRVKSSAEFINLLTGFPCLDEERIALQAGLGRTLSRPVKAAEDLPLTNRSSMDGFAVRACDTFGASEANPAYVEKTAELSIEEQPQCVIGTGQAASIVTGGVLPQGADAVVMVEHTSFLGADTYEIRHAVTPFENVMEQGEDIVAGACALQANTRLRPQEIGLLAALGFEHIWVYRQPRCGIISTGDELIPIDQSPKPGQVRDVNSHTLSALIAKAGGVPVCYGLVADKEEELAGAVSKAVTENDVVFISGGSSVGTRDLTQGAIETLPEAEILAHGVAISPGKPTILGKAGKKAVWGLPGQVTSAQVVMLVFGCPFLEFLQGHSHSFSGMNKKTTTKILAHNLASKPGREDYIRVYIEDNRAVPVFGKSGLLRTMVQAHGLVCIPEETEGIGAETAVNVWLLE